MKKIYLLFLLSFSQYIFSQVQPADNSGYLRNGIFENSSGQIITSNAEKLKFLQTRERQIALEKGGMLKATQSAVEMCTNGGFEQHENIAGQNYIKNFLYNIGDPPGPTQCRSLSLTGDHSIPQYNPSNSYVMATSVPANLIDRFMGDIKAFDQYALKLNFENSSTYGVIAQGKRFKTNNENFFKFNYKAVLQTVYNSSHTDNQAYFKARILDKNKQVVSEFCLVGDEKNCIFTKVPDGSYGQVTLYTANWQSGILDISGIPNNEEFTVEFMASRCGLGGHFGYAYIDDICTLQSNENFVGSITLDPLYAVCPTLPLNVCGTYTLPNSGGITATIKTLTLKVYDAAGAVVYTTTTPATLDTANKKFCFNLLAQNFPNINSGNYNVGVTAEFDVSGSPPGCGSGANTTIFASANDSDANDGWDISFLNCTTSCNLPVKSAKISKCDTNKDGFEDFDLTNFDSQVVSSTTGLTFTYFKDYNSAFNNNNPITNFSSYNSASAVIYIKVSRDAACYKIIPVNVEVKNPTATISGILNVCSGSTDLKASAGATYLWSTGETTQIITVTNIGTYSVTVTDSFGCSSTASAIIEPSQTAVTPTVEITQPSCFSTTGSIKVTSTASEYSFNNGASWTTNPVKSGLYPGDYEVMIKTTKGCTSYAQKVTIIPALTSTPNYSAEQPKYCGDTGSITISTNAAYYSFDNGVTWVNNSTINLLQPGLYSIRTKDLSGCISNAAVVLIASNTLGNPDYTVVNPACSVTGSITINTPADFYTFDGGQTWVTSNILSNIISGNFSIGIKSSLGCTSYFQSVYMQTFQNTAPDYETIQPTCGENGTIYIKTEADFYSFDSGVTWSTSNMKDLPAGTYNLRVKNAAGCQSTSSYAYLYPPRLDYPFVSIVQPSCGTNGSVTVNSISDFYSFDNGATWITTNSKILPAGNYQILIKNSIGCVSNPTSVNLSEIKLPTPSVTLTQPTCTTFGTITINTAASFYSINNGVTWSTSNVFTNLPNSNYNVVVKNSQNCVSLAAYVNFNQVALDSSDYTAVSPSCGNVGNITFTTPATFYSIDNGYTWSTNPVFDNLAVGYYGLVTKNNANCRSAIVNVYLSATNLANPTVKVVQPVCGTKGSITITSPGTSFSIDSGNTWSTSPIFSNLNSGSYYVRSKNATCVSVDTYVSIENFYLPPPDYTFTQPTCGVGGTITITTPAAQYSINNGQTWSSSPTFTNLADGYFNIMIQNAQGCKSSTYSTTLSLPKFYLPKPDVLIIQPTCAVKGSIKIVTPASSYSFDGGQTWSTVNEKTNLTSGNYYIVIKNAQGCTSNPYEMGINMKTFYLPRPLIKTVQPTCGNNGSITVVSQAAHYSFDNGTTWVTNPSLLNPTPGYYSIIIKNAAGCISESASLYINKFYLNQPSVTTIQPTCATPKGSIFINTIADLYSFDNGVTWVTNPIKTNVNSGSYNILIKNASGCISQSAYAYIYSAPAIPATPVATVKQPTACDSSDGSITITTVASSYTFNDGATWTTNPVKTNIAAGTYIIRTKTNNASCESASVAVTLNSGINIAAPTVSVTQPTCSVTTGSITVTTTAATYSFDDGLTFVYANTKSDLLPGTYKIKIKNAAGCLSDGITATVTLPAPLPAPAFAVTQPSCTTSLGSIQITTSATEYSFDNGITYSSANTKTNVGPGTYNLMIKDSAGCTSLAGIATVDVQPTTPNAPQIAVTQPSGCTASWGTVSVISAASSYSFDDGLTWIATASSNLSPGTYNIRIKLSPNGCASPATVATVNAPPNAPALPLFMVNQPLSCVNPFGSISITSTEYEYSFNNGSTYSTTANSGQLSAGTYQIKVRNSAGCESAPVAVTINTPADTPVKPTATLQQIDCTHSSAQITINENAAQYSIDNGLSWQNSKIFSGLLPKTYQLKIKNSLGCESVSESVIITTFNNPTPKAQVNATQDFCVQQNATVANLQGTGTQIKWYANATGGNPISTNLPLINGATFYVTQTINSCESERTPVSVNIINTPPPTANSPQTFCISQNATLANIVVAGTQVKWYSSASSLTPIANSTILQNGVTYYATQTLQNCESVQRSPVTVALVTTNIPANDFAPAPVCSEENGTKKIDLTKYKSNLVSNPGSYTFIYYTQNNQIISDPVNYILQTGQNNISVEINAASGCSARVTLNLTLNASPVINIPLSQEICPDESIQLDAGFQVGSSYTWKFNGNILSTQQTIQVNAIGTYEITVTNSSGCSTTKSVVVKNVDLPIITEIKIENSTVQIIATGVGLLEYSIDGNQWQSSPFFYNVPNGNHTAFVRSGAQICAIAQKDFTIFKLNNIFSPNDDGMNDDWVIEGIEQYANSKVRVMDRFGTVVLDRTVNGPFSWNGQFLSRKLPTGNYWYYITIGDGRILSGYVAIKNRN